MAPTFCGVRNQAFFLETYMSQGISFTLVASLPLWPKTPMTGETQGNHTFRRDRCEQSFKITSQMVSV